MIGQHSTSSATYDPTAIPSASIPTATGTGEATRIAHVTSAVIGCILGGALAGAIFALGLALYRFRRRQIMRKRLLLRIGQQIDTEHANDTVPLEEETRQTLIAERFRIVAERYWRQQRRAYARHGRRPTRRRDDLRDMSGDLYRSRTRGTTASERERERSQQGERDNNERVREPETAFFRFGGASYLPIYSFAGGDRNRDRGGNSSGA